MAIREFGTLGRIRASLRSYRSLFRPPQLPWGEAVTVAVRASASHQRPGAGVSVVRRHAPRPPLLTVGSAQAPLRLRRCARVAHVHLSQRTRTAVRAAVRQRLAAQSGRGARA